jgi:hypothetical protein
MGLSLRDEELKRTPALARIRWRGRKRARTRRAPGLTRLPAMDARPDVPEGRVRKRPLTALSRSFVFAVTDFEASACSERPANSHQQETRLAFRVGLRGSLWATKSLRRNDPCLGVARVPGWPDDDFHIPATGIQEPKQAVDGETIKLTAHEG